MIQFGWSGSEKKTEAGREIKKKAHEAAQSRGSKKIQFRDGAVG